MAVSKIKSSSILDNTIVTNDLADNSVTDEKINNSDTFNLTGTSHLGIPSGTTAQRPSNPNVGYLRFSTTLNQLEQYTSDGWQGISAPPTIISTDVTNLNEGDDPQTIVITGQNFDITASAVLIDNNGATKTPTSSTRNNISQITIVYSGSDVLGESVPHPLTVKVTNGSGLSTELTGQININAKPVWSTNAGTLATVTDRTALSTSATATDADDSTLTYSVVSGAIPPGTTLNTGTGAITGTPNDVSASTQSNFTLRVSDDQSNTPVDRAFNIIVTPLLDGSTQARAITNYNQIANVLGTSYGITSRHITTEDGGVQQTYLLRKENYNWVLVARFAASAATSVTTTLASVRGLNDITQSGTSYFSADWGSKAVEDIMFWGATDFPNETGHTVNWVYEIGGNQTLRGFFAGGSPTDTYTSTYDNNSTSAVYLPQRAGTYSGTKHSLYINNGTRDGAYKGSRWTNSSFRYFLVSDPGSSSNNAYTKPNGLSSPTSSMFYWHGGVDAKFGTTSSGTSCGQDLGNLTQMFGMDDSYVSFHDSNQTPFSSNAANGNYSSAVTVWARF